MDNSPSVTRHPRIITGIIFSVAILVLWTLVNRYLGHAIPSLSWPGLFLASRISFWVCVGLIWLYAIKIEHTPFQIWPERRHRVEVYALSIVLILVTIFFGSAFLSPLHKKLGFAQNSDQVKLLLAISTPSKLFGIFTAAVAEELIFRVYLLPRLQLYFKSSWLPLIISALLFGLAHAGYGTIINMLIPFYIGLVFGWYYQQYRNISVVMTCHFLIDYLALMVPHK